MNKHICGECYCSRTGTCATCDLFMQVSLNKRHRVILLFCNFESMLLNSGTHSPNLVVAQSICEHFSTHESMCSTCGHHCVLCEKWNDDGTHFNHHPCTQSGQREVVFRGEKTVERFCSWLFSHQHRDVIAIAHNACAYDAYFMYNYLLQQSIIPNIIFKGSKIMYCHVGSDLNI